MIRSKTIRRFAGFFAFLILLVPFLGVPQSWKDMLIVGLASLILAFVLYKPVVIESVRIYLELKAEKDDENDDEDDGPKSGAQKILESMKRRKKKNRNESWESSAESGDFLG